MATLVVFSTLTNDVLAQRTAVASMTIRANVVESSSLYSASELRFSQSELLDSGYVARSSEMGEFVITGTSDAEVSITITSPEYLSDDEGNSVIFRPSVKIDNSVTQITNHQQSVQLKSAGNSTQGRTSIWIEGMIESESSVNGRSLQGSYLISAVYN
ncbi:MAG: hypothetical protein LAT57_13045 [Balneolales bacterium]|nr:hypothetical protein [Balneolales bacterium]